MKCTREPAGAACVGIVATAGADIPRNTRRPHAKVIVVDGPLLASPPHPSAVVVEWPARPHRSVVVTAPTAPPLPSVVVGMRVGAWRPTRAVVGRIVATRAVVVGTRVGTTAMRSCPTAARAVVGTHGVTTATQAGDAATVATRASASSSMQ